MIQNNVTKWNGLDVYRFVMPGIESNMYLMMEADEALVVDPHVNQEVMAHMRECGVRKVTVLLTHEHFDHISGVNALRENFSVEVIAADAAEPALADPHKNMARYMDVLLMGQPPEKIAAGRAVADETFSCRADTLFSEYIDLSWKEHTIHIQSAPGHSKGGALIFLEDTLFSGDNLVNGAGIICRLPGGNWNVYCERTRPVIESLPDDTWVFPGHGEPASLSVLRKYLNKFGSV